MDPREQGNWHALDETELLERVSSGEGGLKPSEVPHRLSLYGPNRLRGEERPRPWRILAAQLHHPLIYLLLGAAALAAAVGKLLDAAVIGGVVLLNTLIGAVQEWRADRALEALRDMAAPRARVLRDGRVEEVPAEEVVPGDVLVLETGDRVAADARVLGATDLALDESALTGESEPVGKSPGTLPADTPLADRTNMVWASTAVVSGRGRAVVVATGMRTVLGEIASEVQEAGGEPSPLQRRLGRLGTAIGLGGIALAGFVFVLGLLRGHPALEMVLFSVAVAVSAIPEGLPAVVSVTLALGVQRMARRNAIVRKLPAVETLGSVTVICSDKTGTLTRNEMTVTALWTAAGAYRVTGTGFSPEGAVEREGGGELGPAAEKLLAIGALCTNARLVEEDEAWRVRGSPTEGALLVVARKAGLDPETLAQASPRVAEVPFASDRKYMATLHREGDGAVALVKGAPDRILSFCTRILAEGGAREMTDADRAEVEEAVAAMAARALRVVAGAFRSFPEDKDDLTPEDVERDLTFVGLWGMVDPPRPEAIEAVAAAQGAGIRVVMITGDHKTTAQAVARELGIPAEEPVTGAALDTMGDAELADRVRGAHVFARVTPAHKLRILRALQAQGELVAMTGDGVNDAPALKGADIGVAMGTGTAVAKEAADIILTDDDFATLVHAVEEGRTIFANLRRVVFFLLTTNVGEILTLAAALALGLPLPLTAIMILWVNLVTDGACTIPLGIEPRQGDVLSDPPRPPTEGVLTLPVVRRIALLAPIMAAGTLGLFALGWGDLARARTVAFTALAAFQWFQALNARTSRGSVLRVGLFSNPWIWAGIGAAVVLQLLVLYTPLGWTLFGTVPLGMREWALILPVCASILLFDEVLKALGVHGQRR